MQTFKENFATLIDFHNTLLIMIHKQKETIKKLKRKHQDTRKGLAATLQKNGGLPPAVAAHIATLLQAGDDLIDLTVSCKNKGAQAFAEQPAADQVPYTVEFGGDAVPTHWHKELNTHFNDLVKKVNDELPKAIAGLAKSGKVSCCKALKSQGAFNHNASSSNGEDITFNVQGTIEPILHVQASLTFNLAYDSHPLQALAGWLSVHFGHAFVMFISVADIIKEFSLDRIDAYLENLGPDITDVPTIGLPRNGHCFVPFGMIPIVIGLSHKSAVAEHVAYVMHYCLDTKQVEFAGEKVRAEIKAELGKSMAKQLHVWKEKKNKDTVEAFITSFSTLALPAL